MNTINNKAALVAPGVGAPGEDRSIPSTCNQKGNPIMTQPTDRQFTVIDRFDNATKLMDSVRRDLNAAYREISADAPLFALADVVTALGHLREAVCALDRAADLLEADAAKAATR